MQIYSSSTASSSAKTLTTRECLSGRLFVDALLSLQTCDYYDYFDLMIGLWHALELVYESKGYVDVFTLQERAKTSKRSPNRHMLANYRAP